MTETEKMQQLHLAKAKGQQLSAEDEALLKEWYEMLDREESVINRNNRKLFDRDRDIFLKMLKDPSEPNEALKKAAEEYKKRITEGTLISND